jgi:hypothetical protein
MLCFCASIHSFNVSLRITKQLPVTAGDADANLRIPLDFELILSRTFTMNLFYMYLLKIVYLRKLIFQLSKLRSLACPTVARNLWQPQLLASILLLSGSLKCTWDHLTDICQHVCGKKGAQNRYNEIYFWNNRKKWKQKKKMIDRNCVDFSMIRIFIIWFSSQLSLTFEYVFFFLLKWKVQNYQFSNAHELKVPLYWIMKISIENW